MENYNKKEEKKGGFWSALSGLFRGGSSAMGGASSAGLGSAGSSASGLAGLFATKAGILGMVLGGATIAAGVGVVYNFVSPSSKGVYSPELFQNSYYEEESNKASMDRASSRDASGASASTLDIFKEQARKDGLGGLAAEGGDGEKAGADAAAEAPGGAASADSAAPGVPGAEAAGGAPKLQASAGFGGSKGGGSSGTSIPRMQGGAGLSGGIGNQFQSVYRPPANTGKATGMGGSMAARVNSSPKYAVPNFNKKGAYGQAKYANKMGAKAAYSADGAGARTAATNAFSGETTGNGDVGTPETGAGVGGAGVSKGSALKGNDPSLSSNESTPPKVPEPTKENPWQKIEDGIMKDMMWAGGMILLTKLLAGIAKKCSGPWAIGLYIAAMAAAAAAIVFAVKVIIGGFKLYKGDPNGSPAWAGQHMMGGVYIAVGVMLIIQAIKALADAAGGMAGNGADGKALTSGGTQSFFKGMGGIGDIFKDLKL